MDEARMKQGCHVMKRRKIVTLPPFYRSRIPDLRVQPNAMDYCCEMNARTVIWVFWADLLVVVIGNLITSKSFDVHGGHVVVIT
jgi:hypothetical protein